MHEFGVADDVLAAALEEAGRRGGRLATVGVRLGEGAIVAEALRASFDALIAHRGLDVSLVIETPDAPARCACGSPLEPAGPYLGCPSCGALLPVPHGASGVEISFLEIATDPE